MNAKSIGRRKWLIITLLSAASALAGSLGAADEMKNPDVTMTVKGLACPFCVQGVEKKVRQVPNVKHLSTNLKTGEVSLTLKPKRIDLARLRRAVEQAGFTPGEIEVADDVEVAAGKERRFSLGK